MTERFIPLRAIIMFWVVGLSLAPLYAGDKVTEVPEQNKARQTVVNPESAWGKVSFRSAKPIWPEGREEEKNLFVGFRAVFKRPTNGKAVLRIAASSLYRICLNGKFIGHGPARGPHGYYRVDEWEIGETQLAAENLLAIEVAGYNVNSFYLLDEPSFLQAEVVSEGQVLASTAGEGAAFEACILKERIQKVQRYSFQRPFTEYYRLEEGYDRWKREVSVPLAKVKCATGAAKKLLARRVAYPRFSLRQPVWHVSRGPIQRNVKVDELWRDRSLTAIGPKLKGFVEKELEVIPSIELQQIRSASTVEINEPFSPERSFKLGENSFRILDFGTNLTGFIGAQIRCYKKTRLFVTFDEILSGQDVDFKRLSCVNAVGYELGPGLFALESFEPYTLRYLKLIVFEGECKVERLYLREYVNPDVSEAYFACSDKRLNRVFEAARETFRQNALDIFMDCPSRERAGWLCDSFFTSRVAYDFCGNTTIEKNFFENYLLPEQFDHLPAGMLPMCYPADHYDGVFIPNWAMWFVIELEEYLARSGDRELVDALKPKVMALFDYFQQFKNEDGLLEKLKGWIFVEWSRANDFVQDLNYPTNMLYASALASAGRMYQQSELVEEAERLREVIRRQSFNEEFFVDNAVRKIGGLEVTDNRSETCQYYAFFFDVAQPSMYERLWHTLREQFGPGRAKTKAYPEVHPANLLVGNYLRLELLSRYGYCRQIKDELIDYFLYMAEKTGTLWENVGAYASCNHGFASHAAHCLYRDVLGVYKIDSQKKIVELRFSDVGLEWCEGRMPINGGVVSVRWWKDGNKIRYQADVPAGYRLKVENISGQQLVRQL